MSDAVCTPGNQTVCVKIIASQGGTFLYTSVRCFPRKDVTFESVVDYATHLRGQIPEKNLSCRGVNGHFQAKLADCWWIALCRLRVKCFLMGGTVRLGTYYP